MVILFSTPASAHLELMWGRAVKSRRAGSLGPASTFCSSVAPWSFSPSPSPSPPCVCVCSWDGLLYSSGRKTNKDLTEEPSPGQRKKQVDKSEVTTR